MRKCPHCNGHGADPMSDNVNWLSCPTCQGKGELPLHVEGNGQDDEACPVCFGFGAGDDGDPCPRCHGTGCK
jgi:DnaJ-class molecular chaperone